MVVVIIMVIIGGVWFFNKGNSISVVEQLRLKGQSVSQFVGESQSGYGVGSSQAGQSTDSSNTSGAVREFAMTSFFEMIDGQAKPQFSLKEITVKKGETVRITVTNTKGKHDFNIDEFAIHVDTPFNQAVPVEFIADKTGEFIYYCSMPGHRQAGHWGTLKVIE